jgi:lipopolysaccharide heptosyltransferase II
MMCAKLLKKSDPKRILVVSQTNIGDVVLTCPVIDILRRDFPNAKIDVVTGPKALSLFEGNPDLCVKVFNKQASLGQKFAWFKDLYRSHYDCVVDLRRTALAFFLAPRYATPVIDVSLRAKRSPAIGGAMSPLAPRNDTMVVHKKDAHLNRLRQVYDFDTPSDKLYAVLTTKEDEQFFEREVAPLLQGQNFVVIAPGAADSAKRWDPKGFAAVADFLSAIYKVVFVGDAKDAEIVDDIQGRMKSPSVSLAGKINLRQLAFVLKKCSWALTHDSGVMHLSCYFNVPVVARWGPTKLDTYAPWTTKSVVVRRNEKCLRCRDPKSKGPHHCMSFIEVEDVINAISVIVSEAKQSQNE